MFSWVAPLAGFSHGTPLPTWPQDNCNQIRDTQASLVKTEAEISRAHWRRAADVRLVCAADELYNARSILADYRAVALGSNSITV
jgi:hypothetical protein